MMKTSVSFPVVSFRKLETPYEKDGKRMYAAVINVKDLPIEFKDWRSLNVRQPNVSSGVGKAIKSSLEENPAAFLFKNRGITVIVDDARLNNQTNEVEITFSDVRRHGLLDGGHTYEVIMNHIDSLKDPEDPTSLDSFDAYVRLELLSGFSDVDEAIDIVEARNTSAQVKNQSLAELRKQFDAIHDILKGKSYENRIAYKETEFQEDGSKKDIDIKEILSYLICFDVEHFDRKNHPIKAYSGKQAVLAHFIDHKDDLEKFIPLLPTILELRDRIYFDLPETYNKQGGSFGKLMGVDWLKKRKRAARIELPFIGGHSEYRIPSSFIYPILAALRPLVECDNGSCKWSEDPIKFYESIKDELVARLGEQALEFRNPTKLGKDNATWGRCHDLVLLELSENK
jgi:hypothetical protein